MKLHQTGALFSHVKAFKGFYIFFVLALLSRVILDEVDLQRWQIHLGDHFPYRHLISAIPVYPVSVLLLEWGLIVSGAILIAVGWVRRGSALAAVGLLMSLSQMYQNQKVLLLIIAVALVIEPLSLQKRNSWWFLKAQLVLIYLFTALNKLFDEFASGETLRSLLSSRMPPLLDTSAVYQGLALATIIIQLLLPMLLLKAPKIGLWVVVLFHVSIAMLFKDIWPFTWATLALAFLFFRESVHQSGDLGRDLSGQIAKRA